MRASASFLFPRINQLDEFLGWSHTPGLRRELSNAMGESILVEFDQFGHRGELIPIERRPGRFRILCLGDSFTEGLQVDADQVFPSLLATAIDGAEVINAGVAGYGTVQQFLYLQHEGSQFQPDLVLMTFYSNDLGDNRLPYHLGMGPRPHASVEDGALSIVEEFSDAPYLEFCLPAPFQPFLFWNSALYRGLNQKVYQRLFAAELTRRDRKNWAAGDHQKDWQLYFALLERVSAFLRERSIGLGILFIPTREEVRTTSANPSSEILAYCRERDIDFLDLLPALREAERMGLQTYFDEDIHWTGAGHAAAAEAVRSFVLDLHGKGK